MSIRLGVNIDHVATLRQARKECYPSLERAAQDVLEAGAHQITIHLREDRRHIIDSDLLPMREMTQKFQRDLNCELGTHAEVLQKVILCRPDWFCFVPEKREELTTEGGLNLLNKSVWEKTCWAIKTVREESPNASISLFLDPDPRILEKALTLDIDAVEIHTGEFARKHLRQESFTNELEQFSLVSRMINEAKVKCHAGHGLTLASFKALLEYDWFIEYNIGHAIVSDAVFNGLKTTVAQFMEAIHVHRHH